MQPNWILRSAALPRAGKPIDFLLADRSVPIHGAFGDGVFHARWADYGADRVESWCESAEAFQTGTKTRETATLRSLLARVFGRKSPHSTSAPPSHAHG
jgi:hypothetical protein